MTDKINEIDVKNKLDELAETLPEETYEAQTSEEDPVALERARKKVLLALNVKCKGIGQDIILSQIKPMVYKMNIEDCENMAKIIQKKGQYGLPLLLNKKTKHM